MKIDGNGWKNLPLGGIVDEPGTAMDYETGDWRTLRPVHNSEKCINCMVCWVYCPDAAIMLKDGKVDSIDLKHCKGCGICAHECPPKVKAIEMVDEADFR